MTSKKYDVIVWGATGFTGKWVAKHLFNTYSPQQLSWAIAGRNPEKLQQVRTFIGDQSKTIDTILADSEDKGSLRSMAEQTKAIITTVGPYAFYGSLLVKVCAETGTDYVDLTGEVPWMRRMIDQYQDAAQANGARIVHCCGFDSIPSDMGNFYLQKQAKDRLSAYLPDVKFGLIKMKGGASGGTIHSLFNVLKEATQDKQVRRLMANPYSLNPDKSFSGPDKQDQSSARYDRDFKRWTAPFVMAGINTRVVRRSNALLEFEYGKDFSYQEFMVMPEGLKGRLSAMSIAAGLLVFTGVALTTPGRKLLAKILPSQGEGPEVDESNPGFYVIDFLGRNASGQSLTARVTGDADPGYGSTSKMLAESAVCLALDVPDGGGGFLTPSAAMGDALLQRLQDKAGLSFSIREQQT